MNQTKTPSRQYQAQQRNIAQGKCAYGKSHQKPVQGHECCQACLDKRRDQNRANKGSQPYGVTGRGRPPIGTPKAVANSAKIKALELQRDKRMAMIERARAKFEARKEHHMGWLEDIEKELAKLGAGAGAKTEFYVTPQREYKPWTKTVKSVFTSLFQ